MQHLQLNRQFKAKAQSVSSNIERPKLVPGEKLSIELNDLQEEQDDDDGQDDARLDEQRLVGDLARVFLGTNNQNSSNQFFRQPTGLVKNRCRPLVSAEEV